MLAYAFWHWRRPGVSLSEYESHQRAFQAALADHPPEGFLSATTVRFAGAPWATDEGEAYEDWYLVRGLPDLDLLNEAAVTAARKVSHDAVARLSAGGVAGLYRLRAGAPLSMPAVATWFGKPAGVSYPAFLEALEPLIVRSSAALWIRHMVLGPTPEFCLHTAEPVMLPPEYTATSFARVPVWPSPQPAP